jgi:hypothetical protein
LLILEQATANNRIWPVFVFERLFAHLCAVVEQSIDPSVDPHSDVVALANAIRAILRLYIPESSDALFCVTLSQYCHDLGLKLNSMRKRARRGTLSGAYKHDGTWMVCGLLPTPIARA